MSTFNITLNNPSPDAVKTLVQELNRTKTPAVTLDSALLRDFAAPLYGSSPSGRISSDEKKAYIFDLDGVIADNSHRLHYIDGTDKKMCKACGHKEDNHLNASRRPGIGCLISDFNHEMRGDNCKFPAGKHLANSEFCACKQFVDNPSRNWAAYHEHMGDDTPITQNVALLKALAQNHRIIFVTGRPEEYRGVTNRWIAKHVGISDYSLFMRPNHNFKKNAELKKFLMNRFFSTSTLSSRIAGVFEDNPEAVKMYRSLGLTVYQIDSAYGESQGLGGKS